MANSISLTEAAAQFRPAHCYLNTASIGLPPLACTAALEEAIGRWAAGSLSAPDFDPLVASARRSLARLLGVSHDCVAIGAAVSQLVGFIASSLPAGSEVLCPQEDFSSLLFPFLVRQQRGELVVRVVPLDRIVESIAPTTTLVALSAVQSSDGRIFDRDGLLEAARRHGASTLVDATQAVGWLPFSGADFDFVVLAAYKWLLSPRGAAFLYVSPQRLSELRPLAAGWYAGQDRWSASYGPPLRLAQTARRLDIGPAWLSWVGCAASLAFLEKVGVEAIYAHNVGLATLFAERAFGGSSESAIVSVPGGAAAERLRAQGIAHSQRAGATRLSFHLYNTEEDAIAAADAALGRGEG